MPVLGSCGKSAHFWVQKNGTSSAKIKKTETTFISPTSPKNGGIDICFEQLSLMSKILDNFKFKAFRGHFGPILEGKKAQK